MFKTSTCTVCEQATLKVLKQYVFHRPEIDCLGLTGPEAGGYEAYKAERLGILFDRICTDSPSARFDLCLCESCGLLFTNPRFTDADIEAKYEAVAAVEKIGGRPGQRTKLYGEQRSRRIYSLLTGHAPRTGKLRILDYGGGDGINLVPFAEAGHQACILDYVNYVRADGIEHLGQTLADLGADDRFDVILLVHTLEHATDPVRLLKDLAAHLSVDGLLYIEVPLGAWREWKHLGEPLTHLNFFSEQSLAACAQVAGLGVKSLDSAYQWVYYNRTWCLNAIVGPNQGSESHLPRSTPKSTLSQLNHWSYYLRPVLDRPGLAFSLGWKALTGALSRKREQ